MFNIYIYQWCQVLEGWRVYMCEVFFLYVLVRRGEDCNYIYKVGEDKRYVFK